jgi:hypothetical protein
MKLDSTEKLSPRMERAIGARRNLNRGKVVSSTDQRYITALLGTFHKEDAYGRLASLEALRAFGHSASTPDVRSVLIDALADEDVAVRASSAAAISEIVPPDSIDESTARSLITHFASLEEPLEVRLGTGRCISELGAARSIPTVADALIEVLQRPSDLEAVKQYAVRGLMPVRELQRVKTVLQAAARQRQYPRVRSEALDLLDAMEEVPESALKGFFHWFMQTFRCNLEEAIDWSGRTAWDNNMAVAIPALGAGPNRDQAEYTEIPVEDADHIVDGLTVVLRESGDELYAKLTTHSDMAVTQLSGRSVILYMTNMITDDDVPINFELRPEDVGISRLVGVGSAEEWRARIKLQA